MQFFSNGKIAHFGYAKESTAFTPGSLATIYNEINIIKFKGWIMKKKLVALMLFLSMVYVNAQDKDNFKCGDLLSDYATKPNHLEFVKSECLTGGQIVCRATYKVEGKYVLEVEKFLREKYKMAEVVYFHGSFENKNAGYGYFYNDAFKQFDEMTPAATISMGGMAASIKEEKVRSNVGVYDFILMEK